MMFIYEMAGRVLPFDFMQVRFMQQALVGLLLLAPAAAAMGVHVVNLRMAFFSDAISHSTLAGVALGLVLSVDPRWSLPLFALIVGIGIVTVQRRSSLSSDTVIGVFFSIAIAFGIAVASRERGATRDVQRFLYGDILTIGDGGILAMAVLFVAVAVFLIVGNNRLLAMAVHPVMARAHGVRVAAWQYVFAGLLALTVAIAVWTMGMLLVTALLIVPAAAARNLARTAGGMFRWAVGIAIVSAVAGLLISAQPWAATATGATVILCAGAFFVLSLPFARRGSTG